MISGNRNWLVIVYALGTILLLFSVGTFLFQYVYSLGSLPEVLPAFQNERIVAAFWLSLLSAFATTILAIVLGVPLAYVFAMHDFHGKKLIETLAVDIPQTFPPVAEGMIYLLMLGPNSPLQVNIAFTFLALVIAKFFICVPFVVAFTTLRFREIRNTGINLIARSLGANRFQVFLTVLLPMALNDIAAGVALCWARAMGELGGSLIFAGVIPFRTEIVPTFIAKQAATLTMPALAATIIVTTASVIAIFLFKGVTVVPLPKVVKE